MAPSRHTRRRLALRGEARLTGDRLTSAQVAIIETKLVETASGCWEWVGSVDPDGYPQAVWMGKRYRIHKLVNERAEGSPVPPGYEVDHTCNNRRCCNAAHLERVTHAENVRRIHAREARPLFDWRAARDHRLNLAHLGSIGGEN